jgi:hypothetical protein
LKNLATLVFYGIFVIFLVFSAILLAGFVQIIFFNWTPPSIFTTYFASVIGESIGMLLLYVKNVSGLRTGIKTTTYKKEADVNKHMKEIISSGSTLDIVSGKLSWVSGDETVKKTILDRAKTFEINIYLPETNDVAQELGRNGVNICIVPSLGNKRYARFTLVDKNQPGSAMLAVGCGIIPDFTISEINEQSNAQVVTLAKDYVDRLASERKSA